MDTFYLQAVARELKERVAGARIDKIHQPEPDLIVMRLWNGREEVRLLLDAVPGGGRVHLTGKSWPNPFTPPRFCQLLRSRLTRIMSVEKDPQERVLRVGCRGREGEDYDLVVELLGSRTNLLLINAAGEIVDALRRNNAGREALPGQLYHPPPAPGRFFLASEVPVPPLEAESPEGFRKWLLATVAPMSPLVARELAAEVASGVSPLNALGDFRRRWLREEFAPAILTLEGQPVLAPFQVNYLPVEEKEEFISPSAAADRYYGELDASGQSGLREELQGVVRRASQRLHARIRNIEADFQNSEAKEEGRVLGELLLANLHRVRKGMTEIRVENYYTDPPVAVTIPLDPRLAPQENAENLFRRYKKIKKGEDHVTRRLKETEEEMAWLEELDHFLEEARSPADLEEVRRELEDAKIVRPTKEPPIRRREPDVRQSLRRDRTPGGWEIVWGKNNRTNDFVSKEMTASDDLWFHAHRIPGCHLVLKKKGREEVPETDRLYAAAVAAGYSRGKNAAKVEVMVTEGKWVRKPKGARPGLVTVESFQTVMVKPLRVEEVCD